MDENTKHIVASNLATAYCANRPHLRPTGGSTAMFEKGGVIGGELLSEEKIVEIYHRFVDLLGSSPTSTPSSSET